MVFIKIKKTEEDYFVFETKTDILIDQVIHDLVDVSKEMSTQSHCISFTRFIHYIAWKLHYLLMLGVQ